MAVEQQQTDVVAALPDIEVVSREQNLLVSFAQERMWFLHQFDPENSSYHIPAAIRLKGQLDVNALAHVFTDIVKRHEILHCSIAEVNGVPVLNFNDHAFKVERHDISHLEADQQHQYMVKSTTAEASKPFDLATGSLIRSQLFNLAEDHHVLLITMHHIISDGWSMGVFQQLSVSHQTH